MFSIVNSLADTSAKREMAVILATRDCFIVNIIFRMSKEKVG